MLLGVTGFSVVAGVVVGQRRRLLVDKVSRAAWDVLLGAGAAATLSEFDQPSFYDHLERVRQHAVNRPVQLTSALIGVIGGLVGAGALVVAVGIVGSSLDRVDLG